MEQLINIFFGAVVASIIPVLTLLINLKQWRVDRSIEILRAKHDRLELLYTSVLEKIASALSEGSWPSDATTKILVYGSKNVQDVFKGYISGEDRSNERKRSFYFELSEACNKHLFEIQAEIERLVS
jgi:hypothetical protein